MASQRYPLSLLKVSAALLFAAFCSPTCYSIAQAAFTSAITPDGTLGTTVAKTGNVYDINGGTIKGSNQFHSLGLFSVGTGDIASFNGPSSIANILSRVTGGQQSMIDGTLRSTIQGANLYLMNPAGVLFGPNASLDLSGSFHVTTADYLKLADGAKFYADVEKPSVLSVAPVAAFGFLGPNPAAITIQESVLEVPTGKTLSVVGGDITIVGGTLTAPTNPIVDPTFDPTSPSFKFGRIALAALGSAGEVLLNENEAFPLGQVNARVPRSAAPVLTVEGFDRLGTIELSQAILQTNGIPGGGDIEVTTGNLTLRFGSLLDTSGGGINGSGGVITLNATDGVSISDHSALFANSSEGIGGRINVFAGGLFLGFGGKIQAAHGGESFPGAISLSLKTMTLTGGGRIDSSGAGGGGTTIKITATDSVLISGGDPELGIPSGIYNLGGFPEGTIGGIELSTQSLRMEDGGIIDTRAGGFLGGNSAGNILVTAGTVSMQSGAQMQSGVMPSSAVGGTIKINATDSITISGKASGLFSAASTSERAPESGVRGGNIELQAPQVQLRDGATLSTAGFFADGGGLGITARDSFRSENSTVTTAATEGAGGSIALNAGTLIELKFTDISATVTGGQKSGGAIALTAPHISLSGGAIKAETGGAGPAGKIDLRGDTLLVQDGAQITSSSTGTATGAAGTVTIQGLASPANSVTLTNSSLRTSAATTGRGGSITVDATSVTLDSATISASVKDFNAADPTDGAAVGTGNIGLTATTINMTGGTVTAETSGTRNAGTVTMTTTGNTLNVGGGGSITSSTTGSGNAGQILITSSVLSLNNGTITTSTTGAGNAGSIMANVGTATLANGATVSSASTGAATGNAGSVTIQGLASPAQAVTLTNSKVLTGTDGSGAGGAITMDAGTINLTNATVSAASAGAGNSGKLTLTMGDTFQSDNSSVKTSAVQGQGGDIAITAGKVQLNNATFITAESSGPGNAGNITMNALNALTLNNSTITTKAALGDGGNITLLGKGANLFHLINSEISSSVGNPEKTTTVGGNINIDPDFVILQNSKILANAFAGAGGNITIVAGKAVLADPSSVIDASSAVGVSGSVNIEAPVTNLSGTLAPLPQGFLQAAGLLAQRCAARMGGTYSTFVVAGRDGLPLEPGGLLPSPLYLEALASAPSARQGVTGQDLSASRLRLKDEVNEALLRPGRIWKPEGSPVALDLGCGS